MNSGGPIRIEAASFSHQGGRDYNEDALGECEAVGVLRLFVLADGAGGQGGGDVASHVAVQAAQAAFRQLPVFSSETIRRCIAAADHAVMARQKTDPSLGRMASTIVLLLVSHARREAMLGNLGDSRCYVFRGGEVIAQTRDHSLVQRSIDAGLYPADKLREHPRRNVLYACLGAHPRNPRPYLSEAPIALQPGDGVLLCSDGVWEVVSDRQLVELHAQHAAVEVWRDRLVAAVQACMAAGHDNFSGFVLRFLPGLDSDDDTIPPGARAAWRPA